MLRRILLLALVPMASGGLARGQGAVPESDSLQIAWLAGRINGEALIRVSGAWGTRYLAQPELRGRLIAFTPDSASVSGPPSPLLLDQVERIQVRGNASGVGGLIGMGVGLLVGLGASAGLSSSLCDTGDCSNEGGGTAVVTLASVAGGALIGALAGATIKKWKTIYRVP